MPLRALHAAFFAAVLLATTGALPASADDGPRRGQDTAGRTPQTILRPAPASPRELVILVGGLGSDARDATFGALAEALAGDDRYELVRFGADPRHPYDTRGAVDPSASALVAEIRRRSPAHGAIHLVSHSMGGVVVDRAFDQGLTREDGVRTYVALAAPHDGSFAARAAVELLARAGEDAPVVRSFFAPLEDPGSAAIRDLASARAGSPPAGVTRLDLRLATDPLVIDSDSRAPGVDSRTLAPGRVGLDGHGDVLRDPRVLSLVRTTLESGAAPRDERPPIERGLASALASVEGRIVRAGLGAAAFGVIAFLALRRFGRRLREIARPLRLEPARGQALVEFALVLPLLLAMAFGVAFLAEAGVARLALAHAAAEGARAGALTNDDREIRAAVAAAIAPLDPARAIIEIDPPQRPADPRGGLLHVRLAYPLAAPLGAIAPVVIRGGAARRIEWTP